jgi:UDP-N-acetylmuramoyl-L-alanyl-D-glutamate--2,6-diaminopimelate ligase
MSEARQSARRLLAELPAHGIEPLRLANDTRRLQAGDVFVAYPGERRDGRQFIGEAIAAGAAAVLWEQEGFAWRAQWHVPNRAVRGLRAVAGWMAAELAGNPSEHLLSVGVTGTNGKTSCSHWIASALGALGRPSVVVGTLGHGFPGQLEELVNTTPDALVLQPLLARHLAAGAQCVAMEASSHALVQDRLSGMRFDIALFTNLTRDHLDYHGDMERYGEAKARLFDWPDLRCAVLNTDDAFGRRLHERLRERSMRVLTYGFEGGMVSGARLDLHRYGLTLEIHSPWGAGVVESALFGAHNASNLLGVLGVLIAADVPFGSALGVLGGLEPVRGRMQTLGGEGKPLVVIDYAHTPDALAQVLQALRRHLGQGTRLLCVFGCGGERDAGKRPLMGAIASRFADRVVITSDNPRTEDPDAIIAAIAAGATGSYIVEPDRAQAIGKAIAAAASDDVVLVAGKGHERWQEIAGTRYPFSDAAVSAACLDVWPSRSDSALARPSTP